MKQKEVFNRIGGIIQELNDQYEYLKTVVEDLNDLELELFVSNANFLKDHIEILRKLNLQNSKFIDLPVEKPPVEKPAIEKLETSYEHKYFEPVVQQMKLDNEVVEEKHVSPPFKPVEVRFINNGDREEKTVPLVYMDPDDQQGTNSHVYNEHETIRHELILDEDQNWEDDDENIPDENEMVKREEAEKTNIAPQPEINNPVEIKEAGPVKYEHGPVAPVKVVGDEVFTINQKISSQLGEKAMGRTDELNLKPISDVKLAITLNDKLLYVKDLFNGYNLAYSEAIEILNRFNTFDEAMRFLKTNYVTKNNWDSKPETTGKFYELLKRRYA